jgi:hypothetical protein
MRWAMSQPVEPALTKFLLVALADCVNAEAGEMACWPSYAFLARRTGMNTKTVEAGIYRLKEEGFIVDTGRRAGETGKVVVYRLNDPQNGGIKPGPQSSNANGTRPQNTPESGCITSTVEPQVIPPNPAFNPPKNDGQSPQKVELIPPNQGVRTSNRTKKATRNEPGSGAAVAAIPGVPPQLLSDWLTVRKDKRVGALTETAVAGLLREADKVGISASDAVRFCCEAGWAGFNAGWYADRTGTRPQSAGSASNAQERLEAANRAAAARFLEKDHATE